ncbi:MAG TPA: amidase [Candidatus Limnocylindrales bacterium]|nr:amidase [Candidatus Limnocylindrales bacterium]
MDRRTFLQSAAAAAAFARTSRAQDVEIEEGGIGGFQDAMAAGRITAAALLDQYRTRVESLDRNGPALRSVIEWNPDAAAIAGALDAERKQKGARGPLHGIPVLLKDNIDSADRMHTTAGSLALMDAPQPRDAALVVRLRAAGAVIAGKTNLSEWANFRSTHSSSGWSGRGGQTLNPYALDRSPSGSSSGSAVAVSANLCAAAVGTETDGSVVSPSSVNGIVGIKPTVGLIGGRGIVPISHNQDTAGPMARSVRDAAILLSVMAEGPHANADYTKFLDAGGLRGARLVYVRHGFNVIPQVERIIDDCVQEMAVRGALVSEIDTMPGAGKYDDTEGTVLRYDFKADLNAYLDSRGGGLTLGRLIEWNEQHRAAEMPFFEQEIFQQAQQKGPLTEMAYRTALANDQHMSRAAGIDSALKAAHAEAIVAATSGPAWLTDHLNGDRDTGGCSTPAAVAGYPHITVPAGFVGGLPVGISFFGTAWSEPVLLKLAYAFEQATKARKKPGFAK